MGTVGSEGVRDVGDRVIVESEADVERKTWKILLDTKGSRLTDSSVPFIQRFLQSVWQLNS